MSNIFYISEIKEDDLKFKNLIINAQSYNDLFLISSSAFVSFLLEILYKYSIKEDIFEIMKESINQYSINTGFVRVSDFSFSVIDYLCHKYGETNLQHCNLINLLYWNEVNLVVYDAALLNLFLNSHIVINNFEDIASIVLKNIDNLYYYNPNNVLDFSFMLFEKKFNFSKEIWKNIDGKINDS